MNDQSDMPADTRAIVVRAGVKPQALVPATMEEAYRIAKAVHKSGLAPKDMQEPEQILISIMHGLEIGLPPLAAIQRIAVINGRPSIWGDAAIGLVQASGQLEDFEETIEGEGDARVAVCRAVRKGRKTPIVGKFSVADAKRAGLWDDREIVKRKGSTGWYEKPNDAPWYRFPERMLKMRARGFCLRDGFADVLGGLYLREELEEELKDVTPHDQQPSRPSGPPRGVQQPQVIEHTVVTVDVAHGAADVEVESKEVAVDRLGPVREWVAEAEAAVESARTGEPIKPSGPPRGVSTPPAPDPKKAYKWPEIEALFQNQANMAVQMGNLEPLGEALDRILADYLLADDEMDRLNVIYDEAERALN